MPIHETPWYRTKASDGRPALRNRGGIVCKFWTPHHYEGQDERYERELAEVEGTIRLVEAAPDLLAALDNLQSRPNDPAAHRMALDALKKARGEQ